MGIDFNALAAVYPLVFFNALSLLYIDARILPFSPNKHFSTFCV